MLTWQVMWKSRPVGYAMTCTALGWPALSVLSSMPKQCQLIVVLYANFFWSSSEPRGKQGLQNLYFRVEQQSPMQVSLNGTTLVVVQLEIQLFQKAACTAGSLFLLLLFLATGRRSSLILVSSVFHSVRWLRSTALCSSVNVC